MVGAHAKRLLVVLCLGLPLVAWADDDEGLPPPRRSNYAERVVNGGVGELHEDPFVAPRPENGRPNLTGTWSEQVQGNDLPGSLRFASEAAPSESAPDTYTIRVVVDGRRIDLEATFDGQTLITRRVTSSVEAREGATQRLQGLFEERPDVGQPAAEERTPVAEGRYTATFTAKATVFEAQTTVDLDGSTPVQTFKRYNQTDLVVPAEWARCEEVLWCAPAGGDSWGVKKIYRGAIPVSRGVTHRILCSSNADRDQLDFYLSTHLDDLSNVSYRVQRIGSVWMRDYGPITGAKVDGGHPIVCDMGYYANRVTDDAMPRGYALLRGWRYRDVSQLKLEGGNYMTDGRGAVFLTDRATEGSSSGANDSQEAVEDLLFEMGGREVLWFERMPSPEGTGHIDMFAKLVDAERVLVGQTQGSGSAQLDRNAQRFADLGYAVTRLPMGDSPDLRGTHGETLQTYTNSLFINGTALVPQYGDAAKDAEALRIYERLGYTAVGIDVRDTITGNGAIHCVSMQIPKVG